VSPGTGHPGISGGNQTDVTPAVRDPLAAPPAAMRAKNAGWNGKTGQWTGVR